MRIGIVSDTHGQIEFALKAIEILRAEEVDQVLHCGDIGSPAIIPLFADWHTHFVFGNVDHNHDELETAIERVEQSCHGLFGELELEGKKIALLHSHDAWQFDQAVHSGDFDMVCYGHTHVPEYHKVHNTLVLNPGALFRATPHTLAIVEIPSMRVETIAI